MINGKIPGTQLTQEQADELMEAARINQRKLDNCKKHYFGDIDMAHPFALTVCKNCEGKLNKLHAFYYTCGYRDAGGDPNLVIDNFQ